MDRRSRTHCMASALHDTTNSSGSLPAGTPRNRCVCSSSWQRTGNSSHCGYLSDCPQLPRHLWTDAAVRDETCWGGNWIWGRTFWTTVINTVCHHKLTVFGHVMKWGFLFWCVEFLSEDWQHHSVTPVHWFRGSHGTDNTEHHLLGFRAV
jgi:hypothetical protein